MRKFLENLVKFIGFFALFYVPFFLLILPKLLTISNGPNTEQQVSESFKNAMEREYDVLALGNSRMYRGINPDKFELKTFNFSHDNDTYNQLYYKLKYLLDNGKAFKTVVLGVDFFQFSFISDTRNYAYIKFLDAEYNKDYPNKPYLLLYHLRKLKPVQAEGLRICKSYTPYLKENGQFYREGKASPNDKGKRDIRRKEIQIKYFERILELCTQKKIKVYLLMLPTRENELVNYKPNEIEEFNTFLNNYLTENIVLLNFTYDSTYNIDDFADITHFTPLAADRFSKQLSDTIMRIEAALPSYSDKKRISE